MAIYTTCIIFNGYIHNLYNEDATRVGTQTSKVPTQVALLLILYFVTLLSDPTDLSLFCDIKLSFKDSFWCINMHDLVIYLRLCSGKKTRQNVLNACSPVLCNAKNSELAVNCI